MNLKNINKLILFTFLFFLTSCKTVDIVSDIKNINKIKQIENLDIKEERVKIDISNEIKFDNNQIDSYLDSNISKWSLDKDLKKVKVLKNYRKKIKDKNSLLSIFTNDQLIYLNYLSEYNIYDLSNFELKNKVKLNLSFDPKTTFPTSIAKLNNMIFITYANGHVLSLSIEGKILWTKNLKNIIKTPIKIFNNSIILLTNNQILSLDSVSGDIEWQFNINNSFNSQSFGGEIININNLLYFISPNNEFGKIDTIFGEFINISNIISNTSIKKNTKTLYNYKNLLVYFEDNKFLTLLNLNDNEILFEDIKLENISSYDFYNNSLFVIDKLRNLKAYNFANQKLFWETDISKFIKKNNSLLKIISFKDYLVFFLNNGKIIHVDAISGKIHSVKDLNIKNIVQIKSTDKYLIIDQLNGNTTYFLL